MKYLDEYRDGEAAAQAGRGHRPHRDPAVDDHGSLRRPDAHDRQVRHRPRPAAGGRAGPRPRLPGLRHVAGDDRPGPRDRLAARTSSSARSATCSACPARAATCLQLKSQGGDVRVVYSPLDAVNLAAANPDRKVVFFAIGFETTAPPNAMAVWLAQQAAADELQRAGLARAGAADDHRDPASAGQPRAGLPRAGPRLHRDGLRRVRADRPPLPRADRRSPASSRSTCSKACCGRCGSSKRAGPRSRTSTPAPCGREGNPASRQLIEDVFEVCDRKWRGVGLIPKSGYKLRHEYRDHDAERLFEVDDIETQESSRLHQRADPQGAEEAARLPGVRQGVHAADAARARRWSPSEGACAAYYAYGRHLEVAPGDTRSCIRLSRASTRSEEAR